MEVVSNNYLPGDQRLVEKLVYELKAQGIFDQFRKECFADVDTKPAYQNLRQRVEGSVTSFLKEQSWRPDMNKNQVREMLRKTITESGFLETGVERIVDQVVNPKINSVFLPKVEEVFYSYLGIEKPKQKSEDMDLLPTDLEAVSPESESLEKEKVRGESEPTEMDESKAEEDESPPFEPLDEPIPQEENSVDSHLSGFSGLVSHESNQSTENKTNEHDSQMSRNSSEDNSSRLSIVTSDENSKMEICDDLSQSKSQKSNDSTKVDERKKSERHKSRSESRSDKDRKSSKDSKTKHGSSSRSDRKNHSRSERDKSRDKNRDKTDKNREKPDKNRDRSRHSRDKTAKKDTNRDKASSSSSHKHSSSYKKDKKKPKDDHYSSKEKKNDRRSTDRDSNDGQSGKNPTAATETTTTAQKSTQQQESSTTAGNSDHSESTTKAPVVITNAVEASEVSISSPQKLKVFKPKCAANIQEALRLRKIRKQLAKLEKQNQLSFASVDISSPLVLASSINLEDLNQNSVDKKESDTEEEDCKYFQSVDLEKIDFLSFVESYIKAFDKLMKGKTTHKRKCEDLEENNNKQGNAPPEKRTRLMRKNKIHNHIDATKNNDKFPLPLSPAESDKSVDKQKEIVPLKPKRNNVNKASSQRYSSDDLYKPRPTFASSRRRGAKNLEN